MNLVIDRGDVKLVTMATKKKATKKAAVTTTTTRAPYHHGDLHNALVEAAIGLVRDVGAEQFSLRDAARTVGVSANAAYNHFDNKSALLTAVAAAGLHKMAVKMTKKLAALPKPAALDVDVAVERFKVVARAYVDFGIDNSELFRVMFGPSGICKMLVVAEVDAAQMPRDVLDGVLDDLVLVGVLPPSKRPGAMITVWTMLHGFTSLATQVGDGFSAGAQRRGTLEMLLGFILDGLSSSSSSSSSASSSSAAALPATCGT